MPRYFTRDADHPGYGPATPTLPPQQIASETSNRTDQGHTQAQQPVARVPQSVGPNTWRTTRNADLPTEPGPSAAPVSPSYLAQPFTLNRPHAEVADRFRDEGVRYWHRLESAKNGTGDYQLFRHEAGTGRADPGELVKSYDGSRHFFWAETRRSGTDSETVIYKSPRDTDLGKTGQWNEDAHHRSRAAQYQRDHAATHTLARINATHTRIYGGHRT